MILAQISDPHVSPRDWAAGDALGLAVRALLDFRPLVDAVLVSGDLTDDGDARSYARAAELLALLPMPVYVIAGNHDSRERLADAFGVSGHWSAQVGDVRLIGLDTVLPSSEVGAGALGEEGLAWLRAALAEAPEVPTIVALHHPPVPIAFPAFDEIRLDPADGRAFAEIVARSPQVVRVVCGHVHRAAFTTVGDVPLVACPSVHLQARLELGGGPLALVPEPPAMVLHAWRDGAMTSHVQALV